jgi:dTDP-glucose 4,6-dehydratase
MKKLLITGGAGFIGSNFLRLLLKERGDDVFIINVDALMYAGNKRSIEEFDKRTNYRFVQADINDQALIISLLRENQIQAIINFAAESHVDRSIDSAAEFIRTNIAGTHSLLEAARLCAIEKFIQISTDEVYGSLGSTGFFTESSPLHPNNPYSASKASADLLALSYHHTHGLPVTITRSSNNYGAYQFPEKLIPLMITNALQQKPLPLYGDGRQVRDWIFVEDNCRAIELVLQKGKPGEVYNIGSGSEFTNLELVRLLCKLVDEKCVYSAGDSTQKLITFVRDRPGHDLRYATDAGRIQREMGWQPQITFAEGIRRTVDWYIENKSWWQQIFSGAYRS